jgi:archaemetzincin
LVANKSYQLFIIVILLLFSCHPSSSNRVIIIQPFTGISPSLVAMVYKKAKEINPNIILRKSTSLPLSAYYPQRNRYRADTIIHYLDHFASADTVIIGLTDKDIGTNKGNIPDWGVMGLGFTPGNACVVSTFRISKAKLTNQLYKVALHELGHTEGLPHCPNKTCFMRDAEGGNHLDEETGFCPSCKEYLKNKGWKLN